MLAFSKSQTIEKIKKANSFSHIDRPSISSPQFILNAYTDTFSQTVLYVSVHIFMLHKIDMKLSSSAFCRTASIC